MIKSTIFLSLLSVTLLAIPNAQAQSKYKGLTIFGNMGMGGEIEADDYTIKSNGSSQKGSLRDEDLEKGHGLSLTYELPSTSGKLLRYGLRAAYLGGEGDDTDTDITTYDLGAWGRYHLSGKKDDVTFHLAGAVGLTYAKVELDLRNNQSGITEVDLSGYGYHGVGGVVITKKLENGLRFVGGAFMSIQKISSLDGDAMQNYTYEPGNNKSKIEVEDVSITRFLISAGIAF